MTKEEAYDAKVSPLMKQVIAICKEHQIPMLAYFTLDCEEGLHCTTMLIPEEFEPSETLKQAAAVCNRSSERVSPMYITTRDASGQVVRMEAVL